MLATLDDIIDRRPSLVDEPTLYTFLIEADARIKAALGQDIESAESEVVLDGNGRRRLQLPQIPVTEVASVEVDGVTWTFDTHYRWDTAGGLWRIPYEWPRSPQYATVTYTHGYTTVPADLVGLCARLALAGFDGSGSGSSTVKSKTIDGLTVAYDTTVAVSDPYSELDAVVASGRYSPPCAP